MMISGGVVYIMTNKHHTVLYVGVTSNIIGRIWEHKNKEFPQSFTAKYNCDKLAYYNFFLRIEDAISEEKRIKGGSRQKKIDLIDGLNPTWKDLADEL
ncbi:MAG TPA: GIY-YIG nuclease family protein [Chitinophagales bacterium]|nr:GIY-YIG nuclease family protein [Chitinophagales bacterium]